MNTLKLPALLFGTLLSCCVYAQSSDDSTRSDKAPAAGAPGSEQRFDGHQEVKQHRQDMDDAAADTLDGDKTPEGQHGDSADPRSPGGEHGDGQSVPGNWE